MSTIERVGHQFLAFTADEGLRTIVKISSIQIAAESDATGSEITLTVGQRTFRVSAYLSELQHALEADWRMGLFRRSPLPADTGHP